MGCLIPTFVFFLFLRCFHLFIEDPKPLDQDIDRSVSYNTDSGLRTSDFKSSCSTQNTSQRRPLFLSRIKAVLICFLLHQLFLLFHKYEKFREKTFIFMKAGFIPLSTEAEEFSGILLKESKKGSYYVRFIS